MKHHRVTLQGQAREAWAGWLSAAPWDVFFTLTDPGMSHPEHMAKRARYLEANINHALYGNHYRRRGQGIETVTGLERQQRGSVHAHMLMRLPDHNVRDRSQFSLGEWKRFADGLGGWSWPEIPRSQEDTVAYVTKYVVKEGDLMLGPMFNPNAPRTVAHSLLADFGLTQSLPGRVALPRPVYERSE